MRLACAIAVAFAFAIVGQGVARADDARQRALVARAELAERAAQPREALSLWEEALRESPASRLSRRCETRIAWLRARSEGNFEPLVQLMRAQQSTSTLVNARAVEQFSAEVMRFPDGLVKREALLVIANAWQSRLHNPARAAETFRTLIGQRDIDSSESRAAWSGLATALDALGDSRGARTALERAGATSSPSGQAILLEGRRRVGRVIALAMLTLFACVLGYFAFRARVSWDVLRRSISPATLVGVLLLVAVPGLIAHAYDHAVGDTFAWLALALTGMLAASHLLSLLLDSAGARDRARVWSAAVTLMASLAAGYLLLDYAGGLLAVGL